MHGFEQHEFTGAFTTVDADFEHFMTEGQAVYYRDPRRVELIQRRNHSIVALRADPTPDRGRRPGEAGG